MKFNLIEPPPHSRSPQTYRPWRRNALDIIADAIKSDDGDNLKSALLDLVEILKDET